MATTVLLTTVLALVLVAGLAAVGFVLVGRVTAAAREATREEVDRAIAASAQEAEVRDDIRNEAFAQHLVEMARRLEGVTESVAKLREDRAGREGQLLERIGEAQRATEALRTTAEGLQRALANPQARGQWGERMADDVLRLAGFVEHVNYVRQRAIPGRGTVPDYTFLLPRGRVVHMDVKFPLDNYLRCVNADSAEEAERHRRAFLRDVRDRIRELGERGYDDGDDAVDCVLLFIPNEQLAAFIQEHDPGLLDEALRAKVVCCSPLTLFAVLAVIRQAVDAFALQRRSADILAHLSAFTREWERFVTQMDRVETHLDRARRAFDDLLTTRRRSLERPLERLADLRRDPAAGADGGGPGSAAAEDGLGSADTGDGLGGVRPAAGEPPSGGLAAEAGGAADSASRDPAVSADAGRAPP